MHKVSRKKMAAAVMIAIILAVASFLPGGFTLPAFLGGSPESNVYYGTAEADQVDISAEVAGRLKEIRVAEGQAVTAGMVIAVIDTPENAIKAEQSATTVKSAENELAKVNEGSRQEEIKAQQAVVQQAAAAVSQADSAARQAAASLQSAQTAYDYQKKQYNDMQTLFQDSVVSKQDLDRAKNALDNAGFALTSAQLAKTAAGQQVSGAKAALAAAQQRLALLQNGATETAKTGAQYGVTQAEQGLNLARLLLDKANLISLQDGRIESVNFSVGEYVTPGSAVITLIDPADLWLRVYVPEKVLPLIQVGQEVTLSCDFLPGEVIKGQISSIATEAEFTPMNIVTKKDRMKQVYAVKIRITDHLEEIRPGMLLDVDLGQK